MSPANTIASLCKCKVVTVPEHASIKDAAGLMRKHHVGSLVVTHGQPAHVMGMLTDRDIAIVAVARDFDPQTLRVDQVMTSQVHTIRSDATAAQALQLMREHGVRRLPVTDEEGYLAGIVALDDLLDNYAMQLGTLAQALHSERSHEERFRT